MQTVLNVALPVFAILAAGYLAGRMRLLGAAAPEALNNFVYWIALPPLIFLATARVPLAAVFDWPFLGAYGGGLLATAALAVLVARVVFPNSVAGLTLHGLNACFANVGYMGIPLFLAAFGEAGALPAIVATLVHNVLLLGPAIALVELAAGARAAPGRALADALRAAVASPLFLAPLAGVAWSAAALPLPVWVETLFALLGAAAGPCGLFAVGLFLTTQPLTAGLGEVGWLTALKLVFQPLVTCALALWVFDLAADQTRDAVLLAALPVGALAFVLARRYDVFVARTSATILVSTAASVVTVTALLIWFDVG